MKKMTDGVRLPLGLICLMNAVGMFYFGEGTRFEMVMALVSVCCAAGFLGTVISNQMRRKK